MTTKSVYIIGSLRNPIVPELGVAIRSLGYDVFDDWYGAGERADDAWREYEQVRGRTYVEALQGRAAAHIFGFDLAHLDRCDIGVLVMPAGKSGHLELGYMAGRGKETYVLFDQEPERWDLMYKFCTAVCFGREALLGRLREGVDAVETQRYGKGDFQIGADGRIEKRCCI